jgi:hypothetical protein
MNSRMRELCSLSMYSKVEHFCDGSNGALVDGKVNGDDTANAKEGFAGQQPPALAQLDQGSAKR